MLARLSNFFTQGRRKDCARKGNQGGRDYSHGFGPEGGTRSFFLKKVIDWDEEDWYMASCKSESFLPLVFLGIRFNEEADTCG